MKCISSHRGQEMQWQLLQNLAEAESQIKHHSSTQTARLQQRHSLLTETFLSKWKPSAL